MTDSIFINLSGYRFVPLVDPHELQRSLKTELQAIGVKGAVVLASEGVNVNLAGSQQQCEAAIACLETYPPLKGLWLKQSASGIMPHKRLRVRVRTEIIAFDGDDSVALQAVRPVAPAVSAEQLSGWLDEEKPLTLLDTRNDYEVVSGTFRQAIHLDIKHFRHFKQAVLGALETGTLDKAQPVVAFCTGGIRCEKAAPWLLAQGFDEVYQLEGGVFNYLQSTENDHWQGDCFVFDDRVELTPQLGPTGAGLCDYCQLAVPTGTQCKCPLGAHHHATYEIPNDQGLRTRHRQRQ